MPRGHYHPQPSSPPWHPWGWDPLGVHLRQSNHDEVSVALWAQGAEAVEFCVFDGETEHRIELPDRLHHIFHGMITGVPAGTPYGFRVHGPWKPEDGHRWNPDKLLLDPYARAITGPLTPDPAVFDYQTDQPHARNTTNSAPYVPRSVVTDDQFDWGDDRRPQVAWNDTIIYETHVRGLTMRHPDVPSHLRGTYSGLAHPTVIEHLLTLGVTTVELLPVHQFLDESHLVERGLRNYWGYNSIGYFAPHAGYSSRGSTGGQVHDFKQMVQALHRAGLEVVIDVVYNHTAEGGANGPTLSFRGIGNDTYYYLTEDRQGYVDYTGCGNSLDASHPHVLQLILDSLRYWATHMHVDGFRFDLASTLARSFHDVNMLGNFMTALQQDPVLRGLKLIAEPWDVGPGGYQVGEFPVLWTEWNDRYRDTVRSFWRGDQGLADLGWRLTGSADLYATDGRRPFSSINFITAHDGFTLRDLVTYEHKHNEANAEDNRDGSNNNLSMNYGHEGETDDPEINTLRQRHMRNLIATCLLSAGVPMINGGDEFGRSQNGNNNAYCQDNDISWYDWDWQPWQEDLLDFTRQVIALRRTNPAFRQRQFFEGERADHSEDVAWYRPDGQRLTPEDWSDPHQKCIAMLVTDPAKQESPAPVFALLFNATDSAVTFHTPPTITLSRLEVSSAPLKTTNADGQIEDASVLLAPRSMAVFRGRHNPANPPTPA